MFAAGLLEQPLIDLERWVPPDLFPNGKAIPIPGTSFSVPWPSYESGFPMYGGQGSVWPVKHTSGIAAMKAMDPRGIGENDPQWGVIKKRFEDEAVRGVDIAHENVIKVREFVDLPPPWRPLIFMEKAGASLQKVIRDLRVKRLALRTATIAEIVLQAARGLNCVHKKELVLFDLKPSNVLIRFPLPSVHYANPKSLEHHPFEIALSDLGCALLERQMRDFQIVDNENRRYRAPEQEAKNCRADRRTDIYSLGAILKELCELSFGKDEVPHEFQKLLLDCTRAAMTDRPPSCEPIINRLARIKKSFG